MTKELAIGDLETNEVKSVYIKLVLLKYCRQKTDSKQYGSKSTYTSWNLKIGHIEQHRIIDVMRCLGAVTEDYGMLIEYEGGIYKLDLLT